MGNETPSNDDMFAAIAAQKVQYRDSTLVEPEPQEFSVRPLPMGAPGEGRLFEPCPKISDEESLDQELEAMRRQYAPFMQNGAPALPETRETVPLTTFDWRIQTEQDLLDFRGVLSGAGDWEQVSVPHFGGPLGRVTTYYRKRIELTEEQLAIGSAFVCFKGVDYKAHVFVNGTLLGSHEGFFAPFEFECSAYAKVGENWLVVRVDNDFAVAGNNAWASTDQGDKIYAATNLGYDDSETGWHHCPPGMGIYQDVCLEFRARSFVSDIYVRPLPEEERAELWFEAFHCDHAPVKAQFSISVFGRNFEASVVENLIYNPEVIHECGVGDAFQVALAKAAGTYRKPTPLKLGAGANLFKVSVEMKDFRWWSPETPWLYQVQIQMHNVAGNLVDAAERHFGMRSFRMDEESDPKGTLFLNEKPIRLRGANTMGHEQQCVFNKDFDQLRDDILLAKVCHMNFLRITQRPVQPEVYDYCDMLGLMTQCDLPTFAVFRRTQYCEGLRQVDEMERLVRAHPCNIMVSYINEPVNNSGNEPHRHLSREELEQFFAAADEIVHQLNPERVIKACDGDYDPPSPGIQDRHCYCTWYNGQGVDIGKLHKGYWQPTKAGWLYGCGEFGAEGLESADLMRRTYPAAWRPDPEKAEKEWSPSQITSAQSGRFHYFYYETPEALEEWVEESQRYQASAMRMMTEAFRRDNRMVTIAIHLFIDAFPSGWMKTIMDCERRPKLAYFAYRDALAPVLPNLRTDRSRVFAGEFIDVEAWVCNDHPEAVNGLELRYGFEYEDRIIKAGSCAAQIDSCCAKYQGTLSVPAPEVAERSLVTVRLALVDAAGKTRNDTQIDVEVFPVVAQSKPFEVRVFGAAEGVANRLAAEMGAVQSESASVIMVDDMSTFENESEAILQAVEQGARLILLDIAPGTYSIGPHELEVKNSCFNPLHFVSRRTGHPMVEGFEPHDFRHWYDPAEGFISPILENTFACETATPILLSGNADDQGEWTKALAAAEIELGIGGIIICQVKLTGRTTTNPPARLFVDRLLAAATE